MSRKVVEKNIAYDDIKKKYYVNFDFGPNDQGKQIKSAKTYDKISEARKALKEHEANKIKGSLVKPKKTTLKEWLDYWMNNVVIPQRQETTAYGYKNIIENHINPELGKIPIQQLKPQQIQSYYTRLNIEKELSLNTIRKHHDLLRTALQLALKQDIILNNPIDRVEIPKNKKADINFYTPDDLKKLFSLIKGDQLETVVKLAGYLGLRRGEICGLRWDCVDCEKKQISIKKARTMAGGKAIEKEPKNQSSTRILFIPDELVTVLTNENEKQKEAKEFYKMEYIDSGLVIVRDNGKPYRPNYISDLFKKFIEKNKLPEITLHGLRHTFASVANSLGISMYDIGKALGHSTPTTTSRVYTHLLDKNNKETINKIAESLKNG